MEWYNYIASFFAGAFLANFVPHFVQGISGNKFPTPFSDPRGIGLSSSVLNVIWGLFNLAVGGLLVKAGHVNSENSISLWVCFTGAALMSVGLASHFPKRHKEG